VYRQLVFPVRPREGKGLKREKTMAVQKTDYRTNRADYAIAATHSSAVAGDDDRDQMLANKKKALWLKERRSARLAESPMESSPLPKRRPRG
jgi:hypothetical protein